MKTHLSISYTSKAFGPDCHITSTLCGRESGKAEDGNNSEPDAAEVDCKLCLSIMADPKHWRHRKYISKES